MEDHYLKYLFGGLSGIVGASCLHPVDLVKTRMQTQGIGGQRKEYKNTIDAFKKIVKNEGVTGLYKGLTCAMLRQATYSTARIGVYANLYFKYQENMGKTPNLLTSMAMGMFAGACGALVGTPAEVALIRMTTDGRLPKNEQRNYKSVFDALTRIKREEGLRRLWVGCLPTMGRSMAVNMTELSIITQLREYLMDQWEMEEGLKMYSIAASISAFVTSIVALPLDIAKTRLQNMKTLDGKAEYRGTIDVLIKITRNEGVLSLWKGFTPYLCRLGPYCIITYTLFGEMIMLHESYIDKKS